MQEGSIFEFTSFNFEDDLSKASFHYHLITPYGKEFLFTETLQFINPLAPQSPKGDVGLTLQPFLFNLHLMLGISYFKLFFPAKIIIASGSLTKKQAEFWNTVYVKGLGEFFYRNNIDVRDIISFPYDERRNSLTRKLVNLLTFQDKVLLGFGGGKDSLVAADLLKENEKDTTAFIIETAHQSQLVKPQLKELHIDSIVVKRTLDPQLLKGIDEALEGHVPFSAITAFIGILTAALYDYTYVVMSNERSADEGNVEYLGQTVNHQWSKSSEFETLFRDYLHTYICEHLEYFSLTRPLSELKIAELLSKKSEYLPIFSSCNKNFKIVENKTNFSWCGTCPKCAFTYLLLAAFLPRKKLKEIFGKDILADSSLLDLYKELLGKKEAKPFECVGTFDEVRAAFYLVDKRGEYEDSPAARFFKTAVLHEIINPEKLVKKELTPGEPKTLPKEFKNIIINIK